MHLISTHGNLAGVEGRHPAAGKLQEVLSQVKLRSFASKSMDLASQR